MEVAVPGLRDVRATLDRPTSADAVESESDTRTDAVVVACPPHPQMGGRRSDSRLRAVADALGERGVACLRFDYGPWDEGRGERADAENAVAWGRDRYDHVALFGYSFGGAVAVLAAAELATDRPVNALATLGAASRLGEAEAVDAVAALDRVDCPTRVVYGERDDTADWRPLVERASALGEASRPVATVALSADHHFVGQRDTVGETVAGFLADALPA